MDPWLKARFHRFPSFVPRPLSGLWFLDFAICGIALLLVFICTILVFHNPSFPALSKASLGTALCIVLVLILDWYRVTRGNPPILTVRSYYRSHSVALNWSPSGSSIAGYNVYRSLTPGGHYQKLNKSLVRGLSFTDTPVENGAIYYYTVRAVDTKGQESINSNEVWVKIPH